MTAGREGNQAEPLSLLLRLPLPGWRSAGSAQRGLGNLLAWAPLWPSDAT